jgi:molybdopterin converting factor small subunit
MPINVILPTAFAKHTGGKKQMDSNAVNLAGLVADIEKTFPALGANIKDEDGKLRKFINVYVNDEDIRFIGGETYAFQDGDEVMLIPSIAGG